MVASCSCVSKLPFPSLFLVAASKEVLAVGQLFGQKVFLTGGRPKNARQEMKPEGLKPFSTLKMQG